MKFTVSRNEIENGVSKLYGTLGGGESKMLSHFKVDAKGQIVKISATDYENGATIEIQSKVDIDGCVLIAGAKLLEICKKSNSESIGFTLNEKSVTIKGTESKSARYSVAFMDATNYPDVNTMDRNEMALIDGQELKSMIEKTLYAASKEDNRFIYNGLLFKGDGQNFTIAGTDGRRLSAISIESAINIDESVVSAKALKELLKMITDDMFIGKIGREIFIKTENVDFTSRLLEGKFPDYTKIVPAEGTDTTLLKSDLVNAINQVMVMTELPSFQILINGNKISANTPEIGSSEIELDVEFPIEIAVNGNYLTDILKNIDSDNVTISMSDPASPISVKSDDTRYICIVMPMKV